MHVSIENILPATEIKDKLVDMLHKIDEKNVFLITENDKPVAAVISVAHLQKLEKDMGEVVIDGKEESKPSLPPIMPKPDLPTVPSFSSPSTPPKDMPASAPFGNISPTLPKPDMPKPALPPLPPLPPFKPINPPTSATPNPFGPTPSQNGPLVTESEVKQVVNNDMPDMKPSNTMPEPPKPSMTPPLPPMPPAPSPAPPLTSPFSNVSSAAITPPAAPQPPQGTSGPATWPTTPPQASAKPEDKKDDVDDDLEGESIL